MHFMPNNNLEENNSHFILIAPRKKNLPPKNAFQILGTQKLHLGNQVPGRVHKVAEHVFSFT